MGVEIFRVLGIEGGERLVAVRFIVALFLSAFAASEPKRGNEWKWDFDINPIPRSIRAPIGVSDRRPCPSSRVLGLSSCGSQRSGSAMVL